MHLITTLGFPTYKSDDVIVVTGVNYGVATLYVIPKTDVIRTRGTLKATASFQRYDKLILQKRKLPRFPD